MQEQRRGDLDAALRDYLAAAQERPEALELQINLAIVEYEKKQYTASAAVLESVVARRKDQFVPYFFLGLDRIALHQPSQALAPLLRASALNPNDSQIALALARARAGTGDLQLALRAYGHAAHLDPSNSDILFETGMLYLHAVEQQSTRLLSVAPRSSPFVRVLYGDALMEQHRFHEAAQIYDGTSAAETGPARLCLAARKGFALYGAGQIADALQVWHREGSTAERCVLSVLGLIAAGEERGSELASLQNLRQLGEGSSLLQKEEVSWVLQVLPQAAASRLQGSLSKASASALQVGSGGSASTFLSTPQVLTEEHKMVPGEVSCQGTTAMKEVLRLLSSGSAANASACIAAAQRSAPQDPQLLFWSIRLDELLATQALQSFQALAPEAPRTHLLLGDMERQKRNFGEAQQQYRRVLEAEPGSVAAQQGLMLALFQDGATDDAIGAARQILAGNPENATASQVLGEALVAKRQFAEAELTLRNCLVLEGGDRAHIHALLGRVEAGLGQNSAAIAELEKGVSSDVDGSLYFQLSRLYRQAGRPEAAAKAAAMSAKMSRQRITLAETETLDSASRHEAFEGRP